MHNHIHLIRHAETVWSLTGQHTGVTDLDLTVRGESQARGLAACLRQTHFNLVLSSPRLRARRTCELAGLGPLMQLSADLAEWDYGDYEGRRSLDIEHERPGWNIWRDGCPGGETPSEIAARADRVITRLCHLPGCVALFLHGQFGAALAARWIGLPLHAGQHLALHPASLSLLEQHPGAQGQRLVSLWNQTQTSCASYRE